MRYEYYLDFSLATLRACVETLGYASRERVVRGALTQT